MLAHVFRWLFVVLWTVVLADLSAYAACTQQSANVQLSPSEYGRADLKTYLCRADDGANAAQVKVTFVQLGDFPASLLIGKVRSPWLTKLLGNPRIVENEIFQTYAALLRDFGQVERVPRDDMRFLKLNDTYVNTNDQPVSDLIGATNVRTLTGLFYSNVLPDGTYPAVAEITALRSGTIPDDLHYFYEVRCSSDDRLPDGDCKPTAKIFPKFWRGLTAADVTKYTDNLKAYNVMLRQSEKSPMTVSAGIPAELKLAQYLAGSDWPADFIMMIGDDQDEECAGDALSDGWRFNYWTRAATFDAVIIENLSAKPVAIGEIFGGRSQDTKLRLAATAPGTEAIGNLAATLARGDKILVPTRIGFAAKDGVGQSVGNEDDSRREFEKHGTGRFKGAAKGYGVPDMQDYAYGVQLSVRGLTIDGKRVDLVDRLYNVFDMAVSSEILSCPFLLALDQGEWVNWGKILDQAPAKNREYTDSRVSEGFVSRFRIEEREPEIAYIGQAALRVSLKDGRTLVLSPSVAQLGARDRGYVELAWGDAIEFAFALPADIAEEDVLQSRLDVTGYYRRYSTLTTRGNDQAPQTIFGTKRTRIITPVAFSRTRPEQAP